MKIGVVGCAGRMGRMLVRQILAAARETGACELAGAAAREGSPAIGKDAGLLAGVDPCNVRVTEDPVPLFADADAVIDFTTPEATRRFSALAAQGKTVHVVGTTGLNAEQEKALTLAARHTPVVYAPNMSPGVNLLLALVERVARTLDDDFDIEIVEMHHRHKADAPSGTALGLGRAAAAGRGVALDAAAVRTRDGHTGERPKGAIGFATLRGGDVVGEHTVVFAGEGERIELTHKASSRDIFARGAVRAALWAHGKPPGLYDMKDVLNL
jgi:4-hydroxy-tetrahydrodipicolinate reductase